MNKENKNIQRARNREEIESLLKRIAPRTDCYYLIHRTGMIDADIDGQDIFDIEYDMTENDESIDEIYSVLGDTFLKNCESFFKNGLYTSYMDIYDTASPMGEIPTDRVEGQKGKARGLSINEDGKLYSKPIDCILDEGGFEVLKTHGRNRLILEIPKSEIDSCVIENSKSAGDTGNNKSITRGGNSKWIIPAKYIKGAIYRDYAEEDSLMYIQNPYYRELENSNDKTNESEIIEPNLEENITEINAPNYSREQLPEGAEWKLNSSGKYLLQIKGKDGSKMSYSAEVASKKFGVKIPESQLQEGAQWKLNSSGKYMLIINEDGAKKSYSAEVASKKFGITPPIIKNPQSESKLPIARDTKKSVENIAREGLSRDVQSTSTEIKEIYKELENPTQTKDIKIQ